jgi:hypothetical protein
MDDYRPHLRRLAVPTMRSSATRSRRTEAGSRKWNQQAGAPRIGVGGSRKR